MPMLLAIYSEIAFYCTSDALDQIFWPHFELSLSLSQGDDEYSEGIQKEIVKVFVSFQAGGHGGNGRGSTETFVAGCCIIWLWKKIVFWSSSVVLLLFLLSAEAEKAIKALNGQFFGGKVVVAKVHDEEAFEANDLTH